MTESKPSSGSNYTFLIVAIVLGVVATGVAFLFLNKQAQSAQQGKKITILVAARNLASDTLIEAKDLKEKEVPDTEDMRAFASLCFTKNSPPPTRQRTTRPILVNSPLLRSDIGGYADFDIDTKGGKVALSIPARGANAVSGLLVPNDQVILMITKPGVAGSQPSLLSGGHGASGYVSYALLNNAPVRVLAVGARLARVRAQFKAAEQFEQIKEAENLQTVTLEVTQEQAKEILQENAGNRMEITLLWAGQIAKPTAPASNE